MKKIKIFLAIGEDKLINDKNEISNFIRNLNDIYEDFDVYFYLITDEQLEKVYEDEIKESQLFFILFSQNLQDKTLKEFDTAYTNFLKNQNPKIATYIKTTNEEIGQTVLDFMKRLDQELGHYYNKYENTDTIKLNIIMQLQTLGFKEVKMETKEGKIYLNEKEIMTLENIPMIFNNEQLKHLKQEYQQLEENYWQLREKTKENPDDDNIFEAYIEVKDRRNKVKETMINLEKNIINLESSFVEVSSKGRLSQRQIYAKKCIDKGDIEEAKQALAFNEIKADADRLLKLQEERKKELQILVDEFIQRIITLTIDIKNENRFIEIEKTYEEAIRIEKEGGLERQTLLQYAKYLYDQNNYLKVIELLDRHINYLKSENIEIESEIYNILGGCYSSIYDIENAEKYYLLSIECDKKINEESEKSHLATSYNNIAELYRQIKMYDKAEEYNLLSIKIREELAEGNSERYNNHLAISYDNISMLYNDMERYEEAEQFCVLALQLRQQLANKNSRLYLKYLAVSCNNLAGICFCTKRYEDAEKFWLLCIEYREVLAKDNPDANNPELAITYYNIGALYNELKKYDKAEEYYLKSLRIREQLVKENYNAHIVALIILYNSIIKLYREMMIFYNNISEVEKYYLQSTEITKKLIETYSKLGKDCSENGQYSEAEEYLNRSIYLNEELNNEGVVIFKEMLEKNYNLLLALYEKQGDIEKIKDLKQKRNGG